MTITSDAKLSVYNGALRRLGSRRLASLAEDREPRRVLDDVWGANDEAVRYALERGDWNFALRSVRGEYSTSVEPEFGFRRAFDKPSDFVRMSSLSGDEYFRIPLVHGQYVDEAGYWFADLDTIYIRFVSSGSDYGFNSAAWTESFRRYLECYLAREACERLTNSRTKKADMEAEMRDALKSAKSNDAMADGVKFPPRGSWLAARVGRLRREGSRLR